MATDPPPIHDPANDPPRELPVTLGFLEGGERHGYIAELDPEAKTLTIDLVKSFGEDALRTLLEAPVASLAYVAFVGDPSAPVELQPMEAGVSLRVHTTNKRVFAVNAEEAQILSPVGFHARPTDGGDAYDRFYFFADGVNAREQTVPLGEMLVFEGVVEEPSVDLAVAEQIEARRTPIGEILLMTEKVTADQIDAARMLQARKNMRLGEILVEQGVISEDDVKAALVQQRSTRGKRLGQVLVDSKVVSEPELFETLARKFHLQFVDLDTVEIDPLAAEHCPPDLLEKYTFLPLEVTGSTFTIAISDPMQTDVHDVLRFQLRKRILEVLVLPAQLEEYRKRQPKPTTLINFGPGLRQLINQMEVEERRRKSVLAGGRPADDGHSTGAVVKLVDRIILDAYQRGVSDIHVEPNGPERDAVVRFRIDGACEAYLSIPPAFRRSVVARIKIMARLDIAERRLPQDGKIKIQIEGKKVELRVATLPTLNGDEDVVARILAASKPMPLDEMGLSDRNLECLRDAITRPYGLVLCVGPTGSGKTTTLHSALGHINTVDRKIWTAEDPVEITQAGLRQVQMSRKVGLTFATALRAFLRADPDVIMIGEMRDAETASAGIEASLTGHLVLSTLHTNTAPETVTRLLDMDLDPFGFADALIAVLAQRLARRICKSCRKVEPATEAEYEVMASRVGEDFMRDQCGVAGPEGLQLAHGEGCTACNGSGLKGRIALHELLVVDDDLRAAIQRRATASELRDLAVAGGMTTLMQDGVRKVVAGHMAFKQVLAVCDR
jgi:type II secretory ATPase GspE/PulE/Tfp pilus assembly ATPase PilB-like protein